MERNLLAKCGFYCGSCPTYLSSICRGCVCEHSEGDCYTRDCVIRKNIRFCGECKEFPCKTILEKANCTVLSKEWLLWKQSQKMFSNKGKRDLTCE